MTEKEELTLTKKFFEDIGTIKTSIQYIQKDITEIKSSQKVQWEKFDSCRKSHDETISDVEKDLKKDLKKVENKVVYFTGLLGGIMFVLTLINVFGKYIIR